MLHQIGAREFAQGMYGTDQRRAENEDRSLVLISRESAPGKLKSWIVIEFLERNGLSHWRD